MVAPVAFRPRGSIILVDQEGRPPRPEGQGPARPLPGRHAVPPGRRHRPGRRTGVGRLRPGVPTGERGAVRDRSLAWRLRVPVLHRHAERQLTGNIEEVDAAGNLVGTEAYVTSGVHSHDDGVIHWHPTGSRATGNNAQLEVFFDNYGVESPTPSWCSLRAASRSTGNPPPEDFPLTYEEGETQCDGEDARLTVVVWEDAIATPARARCTRAVSTTSRSTRTAWRSRSHSFPTTSTSRCRRRQPTSRNSAPSTRRRRHPVRRFRRRSRPPASRPAASSRPASSEPTGSSEPASTTETSTASTVTTEG